MAGALKVPIDVLVTSMSRDLRQAQVALDARTAGATPFDVALLSLQMPVAIDHRLRVALVQRGAARLSFRFRRGTC
jgi:hypothetical protein